MNPFKIIPLLMLVASPVSSQVIANDNFSKAKFLPEKLPFTVAGSLTDEKSETFATRQEGEPRHGGRPGFGSVWYQWKSETDRRVELVVESEKVGVVLAVYTGTSIKDLQLVHRYENFAFPAFSRRRSEPFAKGARVDFDAVSYQKYYFAVDTENRFFDTFELRMAESPNPLKPEEELLKPGHKWEYLFARTGDGVPFDPEYLDEDFDTTWMIPEKYDGPEFEKAAMTPIGYGEIRYDPIRTYIGDSADYLPEEKGRNAIYFRTKITPSLDVKALGFEGIVDDGAIIYVNGKEVARINVKSTEDANDWKARAITARFDRHSETEDTVQYAVTENLSLPADKPFDLGLSLHGNNAKTSDAGLNIRVYAVTTPVAK